MKRRPNTQSLQWFVDRNAAGELNLDPPFQRRSVWSLDYQRYFIDTIIRGYPAPPIFLEIEIKPGRPTKHNVLDGKQRISAVLEFMDGKFHLAGYQTAEGHEDAFWEDLPEGMREEFVHYDFAVEEIRQASDAELRDAFDRLNRNVARLKPQELRHAQFPGVFLTRMEDLALNRFWTEMRIFSRTDLRRMRDVEFVSELFLLTMHGVLEGKAEIIDNFYAEYVAKIPDEEDHLAAFDRILDFLRSLKLDWRKTRWHNLTDLYSLWGALDALSDAGRLPTAKKANACLTAFSDMQQEVLKASRNEEQLPGKDRDRRYSEAVRQGGTKEANRSDRVEILKKLLAD
ncbi:MAG: DUF262 domain-containing protein [Solirubrobacterales bacterium]|nr:DUF262 domain-containing protein [Solirubrobacterales bacterium]